MPLSPRNRRLLAVGTSALAACLQVVLAAYLPPNGFIFTALSIPAALLAALGILIRKRSLTEWPLWAAMVLGLLNAIVSGIAAFSQPQFWIPLWVQVDVVILFGVAWWFRLADFEEDGSAWNRAYLHREREAHPGWANRGTGMDPRWEELRRARGEQADPFE